MRIISMSVYYPIRRAMCLLSLTIPFTINLPAGPTSNTIQRNANIVDSLIDSDLKKNELARNEEISDRVFARRVYLDIVGRIPTYEELDSFLSQEKADKRAVLIDELLNSEAYISNFYNFWEDVLRVKSRGRRSIMISYQDWIKNALSENLPYDLFARNLVTADGYVWENGASGYYLRDAGMPLDNMSNTAQVFLGTRMQCAQCHDHPFDNWTQKEYYHMAAYTFGVESSGAGYKNNEAFQEFRKVAVQAFREEQGLNETRRGGNFQRNYSPAQRRAIREIFQPVATKVQYTGKRLILPDDYQYDNARPKQVMAPETPFGKDADVKRSQDPRAAYADWMTSPENPRFTVVIANRLWKKAFGIGIVEPVDDIKEDTVASNPELLDFLTEMMVSYNFDMKAYFRTILNTNAYQSAATSKTIEIDEPYHFQGPILRRMSAEQLWDSIMTLSVPGIDQPTGGDAQTQNLRQREATMAERVEIVNELSGQQLYSIIQYVGEVESKFLEIENELKKRIASASDKEKRTLNQEYRKLRRKKNKILDRALKQVSGRGLAENESMEGSMEANEKKRRKNKEPPYFRTLVRASEIVSPAPAEHFLRQFGQSDRDIIQSSNDEAAIPQALTLLNGPAINWIFHRQSPLTQTLKKAKDRSERQQILFMSFLGRTTTEKEQELIAEQTSKYGPIKGFRNVSAALLNSQEFRFVQ